MSAEVLIIEDEQDVTEVMVETLGYDNIQSCVCHRGEDAIKLLRAQHFQVLIVDLRLGGTASGVDVIKQVVEMSPRPKILIASGTPKEIIKGLLEKENIKDFVDRILEKPSDLRPDRFVEIVKNYLN